MDIFSFISLGGGLAMFLYGMDIMGDGLKSSSAGTMKNILGKVSSNTFSAFLLGLFITALIQSSTATIVICAGLLGAGMLELKQAVSITMGANVGTTITAQILRLLDMDGAAGGALRMRKPETLAPVALLIGIILIKALKKDSVKNVGKIAVGFGILFIGLLNMTDAMAPLSESQTFRELIIKISDSPILALFLALGFTALIASSSASVGVLQTLCTTGLITFRIGYFYVVGAAIGTCIITSLLCSIGTRADVKRVAFINVVFNVTGIAIILAGMEVAYSAGFMPELWSSTMTSGGIADFQTLFKLINALAFLPFIPMLLKLSHKVVKDDPEENKRLIPADKFDVHLFRSPALALRQCELALGEMIAEVRNNFELSVKLLLSYDKEQEKILSDREDYIDEMTDRCSQYLLELSPHVVSDADSEKLGDILQALSEFERIGDLAVNISEIGQHLSEMQVHFSKTAAQEAMILTKAVGEIIERSQNAFVNDDIEAAKKVEPVEEVIDNLVEYCRENHIERLKDGVCSVDRGIAFIDMLTNLERIGDQCSNLALMVIQKHFPDITMHEYTKKLHSGDDSSFNAEYERLFAEYMGSMKNVPPETGEC